MRAFDAIAVSIMFVLSSFLVVVFFRAMAGGGTVLVRVNDYNEMWVEAILLPLILISGAITVVRLIRRAR